MEPIILLFTVSIIGLPIIAVLTGLNTIEEKREFTKAHGQPENLWDKPGITRTNLGGYYLISAKDYKTYLKLFPTGFYPKTPKEVLAQDQSKYFSSDEIQAPLTLECLEKVKDYAYFGYEEAKRDLERSKRC